MVGVGVWGMGGGRFERPTSPVDASAYPNAPGKALIIQCESGVRSTLTLNLRFIYSGLRDIKKKEDIYI